MNYRYLSPPMPRKRFSSLAPHKLFNSAEGGSDETTVTTGNSGGASGNAWDTVNLGAGASMVYDTSPPVPLGSTLSYRLACGAAGTSWVGWSAGVKEETTTYARGYFIHPGSVAASTCYIIRFQDEAAGLASGLRVNTANEVVLTDSTGLARGTFTHTFVANERFRVELKTVHNTTTGHIVARLFYGANINGVTADEEIGSEVTNRNTGNMAEEVRFGISNTSAGAGINWWMDNLGFSNVDWVGPATDVPLVVSHSAGQIVLTGGTHNVKVDRALSAGQIVIAGGTHTASKGQYVTHSAGRIRIVGSGDSYSATVLEDSPIGYWRLGEPSGTTAEDSSGNNFDGTLVDAVSVAQAGLLVGDADTSYSFPGGSFAHVNLSNPAALRLTAGFVLEAWVYVPSGETSEAAVIAHQYNGSTVNYMLGFFDGSSSSLKPSVGFYNGSWHIAQSADSLSVDTPYHIVGTWDGTTLRIYVNAVEKDTDVPGSSPSSSTSDFYIGSRWDNAASPHKFKGRIDEVAIYSSLSTTRITEHYNVGSGAGAGPQYHFSIGKAESAGQIVVAGGSHSRTVTRAHTANVIAIQGGNSTAVRVKNVSHTANVIAIQGGTHNRTVARLLTSGAIVITGGASPKSITKLTNGSIAVQGGTHSRTVTRTHSSGLIAIAGGTHTTVHGKYVTHAAGQIVLTGGTHQRTVSRLLTSGQIAINPGNELKTITKLTNGSIVIQGGTATRTVVVPHSAGQIVLTGGAHTRSVTRTHAAGLIAIAGGTHNRTVTRTHAAGLIAIQGGTHVAYKGQAAVLTAGLIAIQGGTHQRTVSRALTSGAIVISGGDTLKTITKTTFGVITIQGGTATRSVTVPHSAGQIVIAGGTATRTVSVPHSAGLIAINPGNELKTITKTTFGVITIQGGTSTRSVTVPHSSGSIVITGGTHQRTITVSLSSGAITINGGTHTLQAAGTVGMQSGAVVISGGTHARSITTTLSAGQIVISGGTHTAQKTTGAVNYSVTLDAGLIALAGGSHQRTVTRAAVAGQVALNGGSHNASLSRLVTASAGQLALAGGAEHMAIVKALSSGAIVILGGTHVASSTAGGPPFDGHVIPIQGSYVVAIAVGGSYGRTRARIAGEYAPDLPVEGSNASSRRIEGSFDTHVGV